MTWITRPGRSSRGSESPLQLIGAAEWAADHDRRVPVAGRLTPQMSETADELLSRGALFGRDGAVLSAFPGDCSPRIRTGSSGTGSRDSSDSPRRSCGRAASPFSTTGRTPSVRRHLSSATGRTPDPASTERGLTTACRSVRARADPGPGACRRGRASSPHSIWGSGALPALDRLGCERRSPSIRLDPHDRATLLHVDRAVG